MSDQATREEILRVALSAAVPLWIADVRHYPPEVFEERREECLKVICEKGDRIFHRGNKEGETAGAFNRLAEAVAMCAFAEGGVMVFGLHFEATPKPSPKPTESRPPALENVVRPPIDAGDPGIRTAPELARAVRAALPPPTEET